MKFRCGLWITNGTLTGKETGDLFLVYARTGEKRSDIAQFIVEGGMDGFSVGQKIRERWRSPVIW
jgi:isovaleryl-CoA dehydrogenase